MEEKVALRDESDHVLAGGGMQPCLSCCYAPRKRKTKKVIVYGLKEARADMFIQKSCCFGW
jgi:hypothetical protein